jgi:2'-5' RNA ligase superfamily protein
VGRTALIVVVPEAEATVRQMRLEHVASAAQGVPAHITLLSPFAPTEEVDEQALSDLFSGLPAFDFVLDRVEQWEDGIVWLHPEPSRPFEELTAAICQRWPAYPPYEGTVKTIIPHLTLSERPIQVQLDLPIQSRADTVSLIEQGTDGNWSTRRLFPLA